LLLSVLCSLKTSSFKTQVYIFSTWCKSFIFSL